MITAQLLREWAACWSDDKIATHLGDRTELTPREIAADESISLDDRLWVTCKALWYLDESAARYFAIETALSVAYLAGDEDDQAQFLGLMNDLMCIEDMPANQRAAAWDAARAADIKKSFARAVDWLGDYADGWEADEELKAAA